MRTAKMKAYLDSVSQHKIDETTSELNGSFISQRKESILMGVHNQNREPVLDNVSEAESNNEYSARKSVFLQDNGLGN